MLIRNTVYTVELDTVINRSWNAFCSPDLHCLSNFFFFTLISQTLQKNTSIVKGILRFFSPSLVYRRMIQNSCFSYWGYGPKWFRIRNTASYLKYFDGYVHLRAYTCSNPWPGAHRQRVLPHQRVQVPHQAPQAGGGAPGPGARPRGGRGGGGALLSPRRLWRTSGNVWGTRSQEEKNAFKRKKKFIPEDVCSLELCVFLCAA